MAKLDRLQRSLGYTFSDPDLLQRALSHRSVGRDNNERLEFLGDSILNHVVAEAIFSRFPDAREGEMSRMRASLVKGATLAEVAREFELGDYLVLGSGERKSGGHRRDSILADALEAIAGAMLLDSDYATTRERLLDWFDSRLQGLSGKPVKDPKTRLQEFLQGRGGKLPQYALLSTRGAGHEQVFTVSCRLPGLSIESQAEGSSRRAAEMLAAEAALAEVETDG